MALVRLNLEVPDDEVDEAFGQRLYEYVQAHVDALYEDGRISVIRGDR